MGVLITILTIYGLLAACYLVFKYLPSMLMYVLTAPFILVSPFIIAHRQVSSNRRTTGYILYILFGALYLFLITLAIF